MFGSTSPFGQSSNSPFGSQPLFGQANTVNNNPFAPKPFGSPSSPFGQTGSSMFGGTSTGAFGATSSPLATTPTFGATSTPGFGSSAPAFGASPAPAFGGSSLFGQKPASGGFGATPSQTSPFGNSFSQTQSTFGNNMFGSSSSSPFGGTSTPAFATSSTPPFGAPSTPAFGSTTTSPFGTTSTPFGNTPSTNAFGSTTSAFGNTNNTSLFGSTGFGTSSTATSSGPAFTGFGQSNSTFGNNQFGTTPSPSPFGTQTSTFGNPATTPTFGSSGFAQPGFAGQQQRGSRVTPYTTTLEGNDSTSGVTGTGKLESISAMPAYKDKSHEELRWEDYQAGDKGGPNTNAQAPGANVFGAPAGSTQTNLFGGTSPFGQTPSSATPSNNIFAPKTGVFNTPATNAFGTTNTSPFGTTNPSPFGTTPSLFGIPNTTSFGTTTATTNTNPFGTATITTNPFGAPNTSNLFATNTSSNPFGTTTTLAQTPSLFGTTSSTPFGATSSSLFSSSAGANAFSTPSPNLFGNTPSQTSPFGNTGGFGSTQSAGLFNTQPSILTSNFGQQPNSVFNQSNTFSSAPPASFGLSNNSTSSFFSNPAGQTQTPVNAFQPQQGAQQSGIFSYNTNGQTQQAPTSFGVTSNAPAQNTFGQTPNSQSNMVMQPVPNTNPFGTLPAMPQISIGRNGSSPSVQYGISSLPVAEKPNPVRVSSLLTSRHLSQRRIRLPARKYNPKSDGPKVPFFSDDEEAPSTPKADALFIPRENPRALVIRPTEKWPPVGSASSLKDTYTSTHDNGKVSGEASAPFLNGSVVQGQTNPMENGYHKQIHADKTNSEKPNGVHREDQFVQKVGDSNSCITISGHRAGEAAIVYEHGADIEALMPKLRHSDYYTEPRIQELAAKERAEPGFCRHVKDFIVGRHNFGSIKFIGETDVRRIDLESIVQFNNREVIVYMDESKKPPVGQGLNKPAEVTLLNIKCFDKKAGLHYTEGPKVEKYKDMLVKKTQEQDAEFVSYDPVKGEWKFKVNHFSAYKLNNEDEDEVA